MCSVVCAGLPPQPASGRTPRYWVRVAKRRAGRGQLNERFTYDLSHIVRLAQERCSGAETRVRVGVEVRIKS